MGAEVGLKVGGVFKFFGGSIEGGFVTLKEHSQIVQKWRFSDWEEGVYSTVTIDLSAPDGSTCHMKLTHTGIPEADKFGNGSVPMKVEEGWKRHFWTPISQTLGF